MFMKDRERLRRLTGTQRSCVGVCVTLIWWLAMHPGNDRQTTIIGQTADPNGQQFDSGRIYTTKGLSNKEKPRGSQA